MKPARAEMYRKSIRSRPTRGAWIETWLEQMDENGVKVAPHTGRVD